MTIQFDVQAEVVDILSDRPQQSDIFLVDTNVWVWQTYPNAMDYVTVPNIQLFTSNIQVIKLAKLQGKLLRR
ncbi:MULTISPECIES: hypothetical protein [unclassified Chamaesiphon]|uniref:hypothetical protein n=1 Tax=unclassified Chamaesiphon TaxID=2620921 RepID=UPI00286D3BAC|nr:MULTISPECIES: hypothetical protein [unclassified Chamaesiphon]